MAKNARPSAKSKRYKHHKVGSRKATIHLLYDTEGAETAWVRGLKMKLKPSTLRTWFSSWVHEKK